MIDSERHIPHIVAMVNRAESIRRNLIVGLIVAGVVLLAKWLMG